MSMSFAASTDDAANRNARHAVHALTFFVAAMQVGFGPFVSVWLVSNGWSLTEVGLALSLGTIAAIVAQLPAGAVVDMVHHKRDITAVALAVVAAGALLIGLAPAPVSVWIAQLLHAAGSAIIGPAIAAMTLALSGHDSFSERVGGNARYASIGAALAAGTFGLASTHLGQQSIFLLTAALAVPAALALLAVRADRVVPAPDDHMATAHPSERETPPWTVYRDPIMHVFALCLLLFHFSNAALLPLALGGLSQRGLALGYIVPAAIMVPQIVVAVASPWSGRMARRFGRRPPLIVGFLALPVRALLFSLDPGPVYVAAIQVLDGVSATVLGLMLPVIAADLTRKTGHMNLTIGSFGLAAGLGATLSTTIAGWVADQMGPQMAFLGLALVGGLATTILALAMPETRPAGETDA